MDVASKVNENTSMSKYLKRSLLLGGVALVVVGLIEYSTSCNYVVVKVSSNSENNRFAVQYNLDCAALAGSSNIIILDSKYKINFIRFLKPVFTSEYDYKAELRAHWIDSRSLEVLVPSVFRIYRRDEASGDVQFSYVEN